MNGGLRAGLRSIMAGVPLVYSSPGEGGLPVLLALITSAREMRAVWPLFKIYSSVSPTDLGKPDCKNPSRVG
jgi:hypothetical protein